MSHMNNPLNLLFALLNSLLLSSLPPARSLPGFLTTPPPSNSDHSQPLLCGVNPPPEFFLAAEALFARLEIPLLKFLRFFDYVLSTIPSRLAVSSIQFRPFTFNDSLSSTLLPFSSRHPIILQKLRFRKRTCMLEYERIFI